MLKYYFINMNKKIKNITDITNKEKACLQLFEKLTQKRDFLIKYLQSSDIYMDAFNNELSIYC